MSAAGSAALTRWRNYANKYLSGPNNPDSTRYYGLDTIVMYFANGSTVDYENGTESMTPTLYLFDFGTTVP